MVLCLITLMTGFAFNLASAFTTAYSKRWGERQGSLVSLVFRDVLGIPIWALGYVLAVNTPSPSIFPATIILRAAGWLLIIAGGGIILIALISIRLRAAVPSARDRLVQTGIYSYVRHPIHTGTLLEFLGIFIIFPTLVVGLACALGVVWLALQTLCEEHDLRQRLPEYGEYMGRVPRWLPRLGKKL